MTPEQMIELAARLRDHAEVIYGLWKDDLRDAADLIAGMAQRAPVDLHPRTADLVDRFALALKQKLAAAEKKYGYSDGWADDDWMDECRGQLLSHVEKGDPRDVAAYCAFLWHHGESTAPPARNRQEDAA